MKKGEMKNMKKLLKSLLCMVLCLCMLVPTMAYPAFAAAKVTVGKVQTLSLVSKTDKSVKIKWSKVKNATGYQVVIYNAKTQKWVSEKITTKLNYTDTGLNELTTYYYKVRARIKQNGKVTYGKYSPKLSVKTNETPVVVGRVESLSVASKSDKSLSLKWSAVAGATGYRVYFYDQYRKTWIEKKTVSAANYTDTSLLPGTEYSYRVRAFVKKNGKVTYGKYSSTLKAQTLPSVVTGLKVDSVTENSISVSWDSARGASAYELYEYNVYTKKNSLVATVYDTKYTATGLKSLSNHRYSVRSVAENGSLTTYSALCDRVLGKTLLSTVESIEIKDLTKDRIEFSWEAVNGADDYTISILNATTNEWTDFATTKDTIYSFENLEPGTEYTIRFRTSSGTTVSKYSQPFRLCNAPDAPKNLKVATNSDKNVSLVWDSVEGADGYNVYRYSSSGEEDVLVGTTTTNSFTDTGLSTDMFYIYAVCSYVTVNGEQIESKASDSVEHNYQAAVDPDNPYAGLGQIGSTGLLGYLYDAERDVFYTAKDPWQRNFGFNVAYDVGAQLILINYTTKRYKFTSDGKDWMFQLWKGQYGLVVYGGEFGVYTKPFDRKVDHYDCASDEDMLRMSVDFYYYNMEKEQWEFKFSRPYGLYWWCTGFKIGNNGYEDNFSFYRMDNRVTMKSFEMLQAFTAELDKDGTAYTVDGLDVYFTWI